MAKLRGITVNCSNDNRPDHQQPVRNWIVDLSVEYFDV